jgi:hypothetical protein
VQSKLIHSGHLLTRNSAVNLFTCTVHVKSKKSIFFKCVLLKTINVKHYLMTLHKLEEDRMIA